MTIIVNPTLPNILTNGTIADATQVMANFASMISQINTNAAENGANSSITSLNGLTTPLSVAQGGTGTGSLTQYAVLLGAGAGLTATLPGAANTVLTSNGTAAYPTFQAISGLVTSSIVTSALGYTPVQQGTGVGQATNVVKIGWNTGGDGVKVTIDSSDQGYFVLSTTDPVGSGATLKGAMNAPSGLFDNGNRVWSPGNYQPLTFNGIGYDCLAATTGVTEGTTSALGGRPGTWICLSSVTISSSFQLYRRIS